jgi:hypothetical protein
MDQSQSQESLDPPPPQVPRDPSSVTSLKRGRAVSEPSPHDVATEPASGDGTHNSDDDNNDSGNNGTSPTAPPASADYGVTGKTTPDPPYLPQLKRRKVPPPDIPPPPSEGILTPSIAAESSVESTALFYPHQQYDTEKHYQQQSLQYEEDSLMQTPNRPRKQQSPSSSSYSHPEEHEEDILETPALFKSSESDRSSASSSERHACLSPTPSSSSLLWRMEVPPAPPSTPATASHSLYHSWDMGAATPLPILHGDSVHNASLLEHQQWQKQQKLLQQQQDALLSDGAVTPAPTHWSQRAGPKDSQSTVGTTASTTTTSSSSHKALPPDDFSDWAVGDRYELVRILGRGSYGEVAQAIDLHAPQPDAFVAIKRIQSPFDQEVDAIRLYREMHILRRMRGHECIIQLLDVVPPPTDDLDDFHDLYLVFECKCKQMCIH